MRHLILFFITASLFLMGCEQEVEFAQLEELPGPGSSTTAPPVVVVPPVDPPEPPVPPVPGGPVVRFLKAPINVQQGQYNEAVFEVIKGDFKVDSVKCSVNKAEVPCDWQKGLVKLVDYPVGSHEIEVVAVDIEGLKSEAKESWQVMVAYQQMRDLLRVNAKSKMSDILFVIDNSSSMWNEQTKISRRFSNFISKIRGLDWQIGITTTDSRQGGHRYWADGKLDPFPNKEWFLTSAMGERKAQELFAEHVQRDESGSDTEVGIYATYRAIERSIANHFQTDRALHRFFRKNASLSVVIVSDEDESRSGEKNSGDNLLKLVESAWGKNKVFQWNSIIVHTEECLRGEGKTMGRRYERLSKKTGGIVGDVCADNYSKILSDLGKGVASLHKTHVLKCVPQDVDKDGIPDLKIVSKNGSPVPGYSIDKRRVEFDRGLNNDNYEFLYFCLK